MSGNTYIDDNAGFEITMPADWKIDTSGNKKKVIISKQDGITEIGLDVFSLEAKQKEAIDVANDQVAAYDSWEYIAGRHLGFLEKHGADSGFCVMFNKSVLNRSGSEKKIVIQEFYFVKGTRVYIVGLVTDSEHWAEAKEALLSAYNSFRIY